MHDDERGLEVSPCGFLQDQLIEGQIRHRLSQPVILLLKPLQFLQLIYAHSAILLTPAVIGLFNNSDLSSSQTKGSDSCTVLVNSKLQKQLSKYAAQYPKHITKFDTKLIFSAKRRGFSAQTIVNLFQRLYASAGIQGASSHSGRRQFVTKLADQGINARLVQTLARHKASQHNTALY